MAITEFEVQKGLSIEGVSNIIKGAVDPSAGVGVASPISSIYLDTVTGNTWHKTSAPDTGWVKLLDTANDPIFESVATNVDANPVITIDSVPVATVCMAEWHICITETVTPTKRESFKMTALNDGTISNIDSNLYAKNKTGGGITGLVMDVIGAAGNMSLQIFASVNIDYSFYRLKG